MVATAGAAGLCQRMLLERSIHADASARRRVCGNRARATARPSWASLAAVAVCGGVRECILAARAGCDVRGLGGLTCHCCRPEKKEFFSPHVSRVFVAGFRRSGDLVGAGAHQRSNGHFRLRSSSNCGAGASRERQRCAAVRRAPSAHLAMNGALGADRVPEQEMVPDDGRRRHSWSLASYL